MAKEPEDILKRLSLLHDRFSRFWGPVHERIEWDRSYHEGQHYEGDQDLLNKDAASMVFVGQESSSVVRLKVGQLTDTPAVVEARPVDEHSDADDAEEAVALIEWEHHHPQKGYAECVELMYVSALAARIGMFWLDYDKDCGPFGEILFRPGDTLQMMWTPGFFDPHDLKCDCLVEDRVLPLDEAKAIKGIKPKVRDALVAEDVMVGTPISGFKSTHGQGTRPVGDDIQDGAVRLRYWWFKNDRTVKEKERGPFVEFDDPGQRYMACGAPGQMGCGWQSPTQAEGGVDPETGKPAELPEFQPTMCPDCGGDISRIDGKAQVDEILVYPKGRRLVIEAPGQSVDEPLYDGPWPIARARSFPVCVLTAYLPADPTQPCGPSDTSLNASAQSASDYLMTKVFRSTAEYQMYYALPKVGVESWDGRQFQFKDDQLNVMYWDEQKFGPTPPQITAMQGTTIDPATAQVMAMIRDKLLGSQGTNDLGLTTESSRNIPATSIMQMNQVGNIPVAHLKRRAHRALGKTDGVLWDYILATYTAKRLARLQQGDGTDVVKSVHGDSLPNYDFVISDSPDFSGLEKTKSEALQTLIQTPPEWQELMAQVNNIPPSILRKVQKKQAEIAQQQAELMAANPLAAMAGAVPGSPEQAGSNVLQGAAGKKAPTNGTNPAAPLQAGMGGMTPRL